MDEAYERAGAGTPRTREQLQFRLRLPDNTRMGPFPAQTVIDLYSGGGVPEGAFVRREPDGAWLPFHTAFRNILPRKIRSEKKPVRDRRTKSAFTIIDRRRGKFRMFSQIALCASLSLFLGLLLVLR